MADKPSTVKKMTALGNHQPFSDEEVAKYGYIDATMTGSGGFPNAVVVHILRDTTSSDEARYVKESALRKRDAMFRRMPEAVKKQYAEDGAAYFRLSEMIAESGGVSILEKFAKVIEDIEKIGDADTRKRALSMFAEALKK